METGVALVAKIAWGKKVLVKEQQVLAQKGKMVMAGRPMGTTVLPHDALKVYLGAPFEARVRRRCHDLVAMGKAVDYHAIFTDLIWQDEIHSERAFLPPQTASDVRHGYTDGLSTEQVLAEILDTMGES